MRKGANQAVKRGTIRGLYLAIMLSLLFLADLGSALAADHQLITSISLIHEYNDNIRLNTSNELSDNITTVAPKLAFVRHHERYTVSADAMLEAYRYDDLDTFNDVDQWYNGSFTATPSERWRVGADLHASDDNRPDRDVEETGLVLNNIRRRSVKAGTSANYMFSEKVNGGLFLQFNRENFDDPQTSDQKDYHIVCMVTRSLSDWLARTTGRLHVGYDRYLFERDYDRNSTYGSYEYVTQISDDYKVDNYSLTVGTETALTEKLGLTVDLGGRLASSRRDLSVSGLYSSDSTEDSDSYGFVGTIDLSHRGERTRYELLMSHDLQPVSGENNAVNRTTVRVGGSYRFLEHLRGNLYVKWYRNANDEDDSTQENIDQQTWNIGGGLRWALNDHFDLAVTYGYTFLDDRDDDTTAYRNKAMITLEAHHDWLE